MSELSVQTRSAPNGIWLAVGVVASTAISLLYWLAVFLGSEVPEGWGLSWAYSGIALPGALLGATLSYITGRRIYFWAGIAITLIPVAIGVAFGNFYEPVWNNEPID